MLRAALPAENAIAPAPDAPAAPARTARLLLRALRPHQWVKNLLVFLPLLGAHHFRDGAALARSLLAFAAFSLAASGVYVTNDLVDLESDRRHARKRSRPFASGALPVRHAYWLVPALLAAAASLALLLPRAFGLTLAGYFAATLAYSLVLKRYAIIDVMLLAGLYTARIYAGSFAAGVPVSEWLASFSLFLFLSLALVKRCSELARASEALPGRGYAPGDRPAVLGMGIASGYLSVLVLALYVTNREVLRLYSHPAWLWLLCVLVLYWVSAIWLAASRGEVDDDPVVYAAKQPRSWIVAALAVLVAWAGM